MKIFDCFMYFDEEVILDLRLNELDKSPIIVSDRIFTNVKLFDFIKS